MSWKSRLRDLICAGGTLAAAGCAPSGPHIPCGNASSDPCICGRDTTQAQKDECTQRDACQTMGGTWSDPLNNYANHVGDGGTPRCIVGADAGVGRD